MDERVLCGGTKGERRLVFFSAAEKTEHIVGRLAQVVLGVDFWEWDSMWEPVDSEDVPALGSGWDVTFVAAVVVEGWTHVPAVDSMGSHVGVLGWSDMGNDSGARWCQRSVQKIEGLVEAGVGR